MCQDTWFFTALDDATEAKIADIEADLVAIVRDEALLEEQRFVPRDGHMI